MDLIKYSVQITETALFGFDEAVQYIAESLKNHSAAQRLLNDFNDSLDHVANYPFSMPRVSHDYGADYRKFFVGNFIVIYRIADTEQVIYVVAFRYAPMSLGDSI